MQILFNFVVQCFSKDTGNKEVKEYMEYLMELNLMEFKYIVRNAKLVIICNLIKLHKYKQALHKFFSTNLKRFSQLKSFLIYNCLIKRATQIV